MDVPRLVENTPGQSAAWAASAIADVPSASAAQAADWPRLAEAPGSPRLDLALREASGAPAGPTAESHLAYGAGATPSPCRTASSSRPTCQVRVRVRARARVRVRVTLTLTLTLTLTPTLILTLGAVAAFAFVAIALPLIPTEDAAARRSVTLVLAGGAAGLLQP